MVKSIFKPIHIFIYILLLSIGIIYSEAAVETSKNVITIQINGTINPSTTDYIKSGLLEAKKMNSEALLILMDTPGGPSEFNKRYRKTSS